jgi:hypothetical protein
LIDDSEEHHRGGAGNQENPGSILSTRGLAGSASTEYEREEQNGKDCQLE